MATAYLALGANLGDPAAQIAAALARLDAHAEIAVAARSTAIATKPWGRTDQPDFINLVAQVETGLAPTALLDACLGIERAMGRVRAERWGPRLIDIDIVVYERLVFRTGRLTLPHPYAHGRGFVLGPLREIAPEVADWIVAQANARKVGKRSSDKFLVVCE
ncbi:MAG: 2-amino-4-hydroxy-6-hydroxymethyldihydropteridine diphosphokinase [Alphaproteobacteria bacterium]|nr:2-amino-4-hydroxy-6-hydroxymethyldihydropteridine diphosphokinase [Alphaproteobacteria bacterium]